MATSVIRVVQAATAHNLCIKHLEYIDSWFTRTAVENIVFNIRNTLCHN